VLVVVLVVVLVAVPVVVLVVVLVAVLGPFEGAPPVQQDGATDRPDIANWGRQGSPISGSRAPWQTGSEPDRGPLDCENPLVTVSRMYAPVLPEPTDQHVPKAHEMSVSELTPAAFMEL
jgi:hypothetical protein